MLPPYISNYQLQDAIQNLSLTSTYSQITEEEIRKQVIARAAELGIELRPKQVSVKKGGGTVEIVARYDVPIDLLVKQFEIHFEPSGSNRNITSTKP